MIIYRKIADKNLKQFPCGVPTDQRLEKYFDNCFKDLFSELGLHPCWICTNCMMQGKLSWGWGARPKKCPECGKSSTYRVGNFNAWASHIGKMFEVAVHHLLKEIFELPIALVSDSAELYDLEVSYNIKLEAKGSSYSITLPNGNIYKFENPGAKRTDTKKKAFSNAENYKGKHPNHKFYIVSNAVPSGLTAENRKADKIIDVTNGDDLSILSKEIQNESGNTLRDFC